MEGNTSARRHAKFVPGAIAKGYVSTREPMLKDEYDEWLARVVCFAFSIAPSALTRQMNRATAATVQEAALGEGLAPLLRWVKQLIDRVIAEEFGWLDLEFAWVDAPALSPLEQARIHELHVRSGIKTVDEVRAELGLDPAIVPALHIHTVCNPKTRSMQCDSTQRSESTIAPSGWSMATRRARASTATANG